jgi:hypothetical protein
MDNQPQNIDPNNPNFTPNPVEPTSTQDFSYFDPTQSQNLEQTTTASDYYNPQVPEIQTDFSSTTQTDFVQPPVVDQYNPQLEPTLNPDFSSTSQPAEQIYTGAQPAYTEPVNTFVDQAAPSENTFVEQKTGNKRLLIIAGAIIGLLVVVASTLVFLNRPSTINTTPIPSEQTPVANSDLNKPKEIKIDTATTGGNDTPATKARVNSLGKIETDWLKKKFVSPIIDESGTCIVLETCGDDADKDKDGLTTLQEFQFDSDPQNEDTDADNIADGDEVFIYYSDPKKADSDDDKFKDGEEIAACYDSIVVADTTISTERLTTIGNNVSLKQLHEPTLKTIKSAGATQSDVNSKGVSTAKCGKPAPATTTPAPTTAN